MPAPNAIPGLKRLPKKGGISTWYWSARQIARDAGDFRPRTMRLWHGAGEPAPLDLAEIRRAAYNLTLDLKDWRAGRTRRARQPSGRMRGLIYFARAGERVKIGFSKDVAIRIAQLQRNVPDEIELLLTMAGSPVLERELLGSLVPCACAMNGFASRARFGPSWQQGWRTRQNRVCQNHLRSSESQKKGMESQWVTEGVWSGQLDSNQPQVIEIAHCDSDDHPATPASRPNLPCDSDTGGIGGRQSVALRLSQMECVARA